MNNMLDGIEPWEILVDCVEAIKQNNHDLEILNQTLNLQNNAIKELMGQNRALSKHLSILVKKHKELQDIVQQQQ